MKKLWILITTIGVLIILVGFMLSNDSVKAMKPTSQLAEKRIDTFAAGINYNNPEVIYEHLLKEYQQEMAKEDFINHWNKERSYPYLTPLFIYIDEVTFTDELLKGRVKAVVAARLPGEYMYFDFTWQNDNYYIDAFPEIIDKSYLQKFARLNSSN